MAAGISIDSSARTTAYVGQSLMNTTTWIKMMAVSFKDMDAQRAELNANGPWTVSTRSIGEYVARFDAYF